MFFYFLLQLHVRKNNIENYKENKLKTNILCIFLNHAKTF